MAMKTGNSKVTRSELSNLIGKLQAERSEMFQKINEIDRKLKAIETTMNLLGHNGRDIEQSNKYDNLILRLRNDKNHGNLSQIKALEIIALDIGKSSGTFKVKDIKRIMINAGMFKNPIYANSIIYTLMDRSGKFKKVEPGVYRIIDTKTINSEIISYSHRRD